MNREKVIEENLRLLRKQKRKLVQRRIDLIRDGSLPEGIRHNKLSKVEGKIKKTNKEISALIREERELKGIPIPQSVRVGMKSAKVIGRLRS